MNFTRHAMGFQSSSTPTTAPASMVTSVSTSLSFKLASFENLSLSSKRGDLSGKNLGSPPETRVVHHFPRRSDSGVVLCSTLFCEKFLKCKVLGDGAFGWVYLVEEIATRKKFAVKLETTNTGGNLQQEWEFQRHLDHPSTVRVYDFYKGRIGGGTVMELGENCIFDMMRANRKWYIGEAQMKVYFKDILLGIQYLHSQNIIHRDIKLENVILGCDPERRMKLSDFGFSQKLKPGKRIYKNTREGTLPYIAPECFSRDAKIIGIGLEVDIWAAGVVLFECLKGYSPFSGDEEDSQKGLDTIKRRITEYRFIDPPPGDTGEVSPEAEDLIMGMLKFDFNERWTVEQCLAHPWINGHSLS